MVKEKRGFTAEAQRSQSWRGEKRWVMKFLWVFGVCVLGLGEARGQAPAKAPSTRAVGIAWDTTRATSPVTADGRVDYFGATNEHFGRGVTAQNNAAVPLLRALGPVQGEEGRKRQAAMRKGLGLPPLGEKAAPGEHLVSAKEFVDQSETIPFEERENLRQTAGTILADWPAELSQWMGDWVKANERPLALVVEASRRERFFVPASADDGVAVPLLMDFIQPTLASYRDAAFALCVRASLRLSAKDFEGFKSDLAAVGRLGGLIRQGPHFIDRLVGTGIGLMALRCAASAAGDGRLTAAQLKSLMAELERATAEPDYVDAIDLHERYTLLDYLQWCAKLGPDGVARARGARKLAGGVSIPMPTGHHDWMQAMRNVNGWFDKSVAALREPEGPGRGAALEAFRKDRDKLHDANFGMLGVFSPPENKLVGALMTSPGTLESGRMRHGTERELCLAALAMAAYQGEKGAYPAEVAALAPGYVKAVPVDRFNGKGLVYQNSGEAFVLYSVGPNRIDDGGVGGTGRKDDIAVRGGKRPPPPAEDADQ